MKPTVVLPRMLAPVGNGSRFNVKDPSACLTTTATSERKRYGSFHPSLMISSFT